MTEIVLVQASHILPDAEVIAALPSLTKWAKLVTDAYGLEPVTFSFMSLAMFMQTDRGLWPLFINRHSTDPGALGFHDQANGVPYGRSFAGDDILDRISPWVTLSHEAGEMILNPHIQNFFNDRLGNRYPMELCDVFEDDIQAIEIDGYKWSNAALPPYWDDLTAHPPGTKFDLQGRGQGPCPALTPGGYLPILRPGAPAWTQITEMRLGSRPRPSVRSQRFHGSLRHRQLEAATPSGGTP
jgi:hypothetical protein